MIIQENNDPESLKNTQIDDNEVLACDDIQNKCLYSLLRQEDHQTLYALSDFVDENYEGLKDKSIYANLGNSLLKKKVIPESYLYIEKDLPSELDDILLEKKDMIHNFTIDEQNDVKKESNIEQEPNVKVTEIGKLLITYIGLLIHKNMIYEAENVIAKYRLNCKYDKLTLANLHKLDLILKMITYIGIKDPNKEQEMQDSKLVKLAQT